MPLNYTREPSLRERVTKWTVRHPRLTSVTTIAVLVTAVTYGVGTYLENHRIAQLRHEVDSLVLDGRDAMDHDEPDVAQGRFRAAWMKVQAEPALLEYLPGVAGWLDHSRRAVVQTQWKQRIPPREFDARRDEAILYSLLLDPPLPTTVGSARDAIHSALELTIAGDPGWEHERELLLHLEADLVAAKSGTKQALELFDDTAEFTSRAYLEHRARLLEKLGRTTEAQGFRERAQQLPRDELADVFLTGINRLRRRDYHLACQDFEHIQDSQPGHFAARLCQAVCCLHENHPQEAKVALSACIAQRPYFLWGYYFRAQANVALNDSPAAVTDLRQVMALEPAESLRQSVQTQLEKIEENIITMSHQHEPLGSHYGNLRNVGQNSSNAQLFPPF